MTPSKDFENVKIWKLEIFNLAAFRMPNQNKPGLWMCGLCMTVFYYCMWCQIVSDWKGKAIKIQLLSAVKQLLYTMWKALLSSFFPSPLSILCPRRKHLPLSETVLPDEKNRPIQKHLRPLTMPRKDAIDILSLKAAKKDTTNYCIHVQSTFCTEDVHVTTKHIGVSKLKHIGVNQLKSIQKYMSIKYVPEKHNLFRFI